MSISQSQIKYQPSRSTLDQYLGHILNSSAQSLPTLTFPEPPKMAIPKKAPLADQFAALSKKWNNSLQKQNLVTLIRESLLASETLHIENTMCLGLGCMKDIEFLGSAYMRTNLTALSNSEVTSHTAKSKRILKIALSNHSLFQLVLFESALAILGEKFKLPQVCFQDPAFSQVDVDFLEGRGHEVLPYSKPGNGGGWMCDLRMLKWVANSTFLYAPYLNYNPLAEVIGVGRPGLILSCDPLHLLGPGCPYVPDELLPAVEDHSIPCNLVDVPITPQWFAFTWPLQSDEKETLLKLQTRNTLAGILKAEKAKEKEMETHYRGLEDSFANLDL